MLLRPEIARLPISAAARAAVAASLSRSGLDTIGIDVSSRLIRLAHGAHPSVRFVEGQISDLPLRDGCLGGAVCWYSIIYTPPEKLDRTLKEIGRVVAPGGQLAWMVTAASPKVRFLSVELDAERAAAAAELFAGHPNVTTVHGPAEEHWYEHRPNLLVLDGGGGTGKGGESPVDVRRALAPFGTVTVDDFTPIDGWPPTHQGQVDASRLHWLEHPDLHTTEVTVAPDMAVLVGRLLR